MAKNTTKTPEATSDEFADPKIVEGQIREQKDRVADVKRTAKNELYKLRGQVDEFQWKTIEAALTTVLEKSDPKDPDALSRRANALIGYLKSMAGDDGIISREEAAEIIRSSDKRFDFLSRPEQKDIREAFFWATGKIPLETVEITTDSQRREQSLDTIAKALAQGGERGNFAIVILPMLNSNEKGEIVKRMIAANKDNIKVIEELNTGGLLSATDIEKGTKISKAQYNIYGERYASFHNRRKKAANFTGTYGSENFVAKNFTLGNAGAGLAYLIGGLVIVMNGIGSFDSKSWIVGTMGNLARNPYAWGGAGLIAATSQINGPNKFEKSVAGKKSRDTDKYIKNLTEFNVGILNGCPALKYFLELPGGKGDGQALSAFWDYVQSIQSEDSKGKAFTTKRGEYSTEKFKEFLAKQVTVKPNEPKYAHALTKFKDLGPKKGVTDEKFREFGRAVINLKLYGSPLDASTQYDIVAKEVNDLTV
jgi:hypothetical protein